jgi:hypothetical protein
MDGKSLGQIAYEGYCERTMWKSLGLGLPKWQELPEHLKSGWEAAAEAVVLWIQQQCKTVKEIPVKCANVGLR